MESFSLSDFIFHVSCFQNKWNCLSYDPKLSKKKKKQELKFFQIYFAEPEEQHKRRYDILTKPTKGAKKKYNVSSNEKKILNEIISELQKEILDTNPLAKTFTHLKDVFLCATFYLLFFF